jgi:multidrug efflux system membrane fusion protein
MKPAAYLIALALLGSGMVTGCSKKEPPPGGFPSPIVSSTVKTQDVPVYISTIGNVNSQATVEVRPQVTGKLIAVHVKQGQNVKKGDLLYSIDPKPFQAELDKAKATLVKDQANLEYARDRLARYKELVKKEYVSQLNYDEYQSNVAALEGQVMIDLADVTYAEINLGYTSVTAPIDGRLSGYDVDVGNLVSPTDTRPLTTIRQISPIDVNFYLPQYEFQRIKQLQSQSPLTVEATIPKSTIQETFQGKVYFIDNNLSLNTGTILLKAVFQNENRILWPGEFVEVKLLLKTQPKALIVPFAAVQMGQQGSYVYIVKPDNTVELRNVKTGVRYNDYIVIEDGVKDGEKIVIDGQVNLRNGSQVYEKKPTDEKKG